jgi:hypothetical protein
MSAFAPPAELFCVGHKPDIRSEESSMQLHRSPLVPLPADGPAQCAAAGVKWD